MTEFYSKNSSLYLGNDKLRIKGVNWFGLETETYDLHGLWKNSMTMMLDFVKKHNFNALRIPFSTEVALNLDGIKCTSVNTKANPGMDGWSVGQFMDHLVSECAKRGILIMFDMHRLVGTGLITEVWYDNVYTEEKVTKAWLNMVNRFKNAPNVFAMDLKNEPHGKATWGGDAGSDWHAAAQRIGTAILKANPKVLVVVEGVDNYKGVGSWWGGSLAGVKDLPVRLPVANKIVYSPHVYGPSVANQSYFSDGSFPANLPAVWDRDFGYVKKNNLGSLLIGEFGGHMKAANRDDVWQKAVCKYFKENSIDFFYWCLNPNSGDTGGLLDDDWVTPVQAKLDMLADVCPNPSKFAFNGGVPSVLNPSSPAPAPTPTPPKPTPTPPKPTPAPTPTPPKPTPAPTPTPPKPTPNGKLTFSSTTSTWVENGKTIYQYNFVVSNTSASTVSKATFKIAAKLKQLWRYCPVKLHSPILVV
jgi:endoglucanase